MDLSNNICVFRKAELADLDQLCAIETQCFLSDRLSRRRLRFYLTATHADLWVGVFDNEIAGYGLLLSRRGTLLTRLYSLAILPHYRGRHIGRHLITQLSAAGVARGKRFMRLEVAEHNLSAIALYKSLGFTQFGIYSDYYDDKSAALRMQKLLKSHHLVAAKLKSYPWYQQTTEFTCGPASLMMAMAACVSEFVMSQTEELAIWRTATTIYMTSGHGGCHPLGLALAAWERGFDTQVYLNRPLPLFVDGVRNDHKKHIIAHVEQIFWQTAEARGIPVVIDEWRMDTLAQVLSGGGSVICLISSYSLDQKKAPHWVVITGVDHDCIYLHDPDPPKGSDPWDSQHIPIALDDFMRMACYGKRKIRAAVIVQARST
jgi:ribosomal protein S18 acetylase RimI-like enzyme